MSRVPRSRSGVASQHLGQTLSLYADRSLPASALLACDRHVSICPGCRAAAEAERRMLRSMRSSATPGLSHRLESALLGLAADSTPPVVMSGPSPIVVIARSAPAMYRSPLHAAMLAGLVAGASAAAAWSLGVSGVGPSGGSSPVVRLPVAASPAGSAVGAVSGSQVVSFLSVTAIGPIDGPWPGVPDRGPRSAQSTHE